MCVSTCNFSSSVCRVVSHVSDFTSAVVSTDKTLAHPPFCVPSVDTLWIALVGISVSLVSYQFPTNTHYPLDNISNDNVSASRIKCSESMMKSNFLMTRVRVWTCVIKTCLLRYFDSSNFRGKERTDEQASSHGARALSGSVTECPVFWQAPPCYA